MGETGETDGDGRADAEGRARAAGGADPDRATAPGIAPHEVAHLRGGPRAAVVVALVALHLRGAVKAGRGGTLRTSAASASHGEHSVPLEKAVHAALYRPAGMAELMDRPGVRRAVAELRAELAGAGLLRSLPPRRTRAARRALRSLRRAHPVPTGEERYQLPVDDVLMAVALHGRRALTALVPRFTDEGGLTGRGGRSERDVRGGSSGSGGFTGCGASY
ncbi:TIGR04222 domain-containing membrane protein [Streptomyces sp. NPDC008150]|uniref:TIGR04222 domain-containing membrane protein n=1 Tax=Streptomyces sp. NPDC008150 TaxID=3364816 RepID=UPI0036E35121